MTTNKSSQYQPIQANAGDNDGAPQVGKRQFLSQLFTAAISSCDPELSVSTHLPMLRQRIAKVDGRIVIVGAGKAVAKMAAVLSARNLLGCASVDNRRISGAIILPHPTDGKSGSQDSQPQVINNLQIYYAAHPVPDAAGLAATRKILAHVSNLTAADLVICLISGGGSSLLVAPRKGISLRQKQAIGKKLLRSGASIAEINCVRQQLSRVKAGGLARAAAPAQIISLIVSDVPGDDISAIASGPTVATSSNVSDALAILVKYRIDIPQSVRAIMRDPAPPRPTALVHNVVIARPITALTTALQLGRSAGYNCLMLGDAIEGDAVEVAKVHAGIAYSITRHKQPIGPPALLLSGGETAVSVSGNGCGGRNSHFALALALQLNKYNCSSDIYALAADSDGIDGAAPIAGAIITPTTLQRAQKLAIDPEDFLLRSDSHTFFKLLNDQVITGATGTNVNDFRAIAIA